MKSTIKQVEKKKKLLESVGGGGGDILIFFLWIVGLFKVRKYFSIGRFFFF